MSGKQILVFALIGLALSVISIFTLDYQLASPVLSLGIGSKEFWNIVTDTGDSKYMGMILVATWASAFIYQKINPDNPFWPALRKKSLLVLAAVVGTGLFVIVLKTIVGRARPYMGDIGFFPFTFGSDYASWPSGHTTSAFAFAVAAGMAFPKLRWPLLIVAALTGFSRMVLGVHYLGDVIMGATVGTVGAVLIYNWLRPKLGLKG